MQFRWLRFLVAVALIVPLSGCPGATSISLGTWLVTVNFTGQASFALAFGLAANGQVQAPNPVPPIADDFPMLGGSWAQSGPTFTMTETKIGEDWLYTGTIHSSTSMNGTWAQANNPSQVSGEWVAAWIP